MVHFNIGSEVAGDVCVEVEFEEFRLMNRARRPGQGCLTDARSRDANNDDGLPLATSYSRTQVQVCSARLLFYQQLLSEKSRFE